MLTDVSFITYEPPILILILILLATDLTGSDWLWADKDQYWLAAAAADVSGGNKVKPVENKNQLHLLQISDTNF